MLALANIEEMASLLNIWAAMPPESTPEAAELPTDPLVLQFFQGATQFGKPLLATTSVAEMDELIAEFAWDPAFLTFNNYVAQLMSKATRPEISAARLTTVVEQLAYGHADNCAPRLVELVLAADQAMAEMRHGVHLIRGPRFPLGPLQVSEIIYDMAAPRFFVQAIVGGFSSCIAQMGLLAGFLHADDLPAWKTTALIGACCDGLVAYLQLFALQGYTIAADIPLAEGVTWDGMMDEWDQTRRRMVQLAEETMARDELVFPFRNDGNAAG